MKFSISYIRYAGNIEILRSVTKNNHPLKFFEIKRDVMEFVRRGSNGILPVFYQGNTICNHTVIRIGFRSETIFY